MKLLLDVSHYYLKCGANEVKTKVRPRTEELWKALKQGKETNFHFAPVLSEKEEKSCYTSPISELGKQILVITVTVILSRKKNTKNLTAFS